MLSIVIFVLPVAVSALGIWILCETAAAYILLDDDKEDNDESNNKV